jgi:hypothetical protein
MLKRKSCNDITALDCKEKKTYNWTTINIKTPSSIEKKLQSYSEFLKFNPNASKSERIQAIQKFYNDLF